MHQIVSPCLCWKKGESGTRVSWWLRPHEVWERVRQPGLPIPSCLVSPCLSVRLVRVTLPFRFGLPSTWLPGSQTKTLLVALLMAQVVTPPA